MIGNNIIKIFTQYPTNITNDVKHQIFSEIEQLLEQKYKCGKVIICEEKGKKE